MKKSDFMFLAAIVIAAPHLTGSGVMPVCIVALAVGTVFAFMGK
ncbi:hypothetical protein B7759_01380 [Burkholderia glumae]|nr:hypothetical protein [Burkholderia glumae]QTP32802.1 hypothetical protein B7759_01380 [Burkholderia glumae]